MFDVVALGESLIDFTPNGTNAQGNPKYTIIARRGSLLFFPIIIPIGTIEATAHAINKH